MKFRPKSLNDAKDPLKGNVNISPDHPLKEFFLLTTGLVAAIFGIYLLLGLAVDLVVPHISLEMEREILANFTIEEDDDPRSGFLKNLASKMSERTGDLPGPVEVGVISIPQENAFALPGGRILFTSGLLDKASSENELAMIMAHEIGHIHHRDPLRHFGRGIVMAFLSSLVMGTEKSVDTFISTTSTLGQLKYSREQEEAADIYALKVLEKHYGHVGGATAFFERHHKKGEDYILPEFFYSHPDLEKRIAYIEDAAKRSGYDKSAVKPLPEGWVEDEEACADSGF